MSQSIFVPVVPNRPLSSPDANPRLAEILLRHNTEVDLVVNSLFDPALVSYDESYQNSQTESLVFREHMAEVIGILKSHVGAGSHVVEVGCGKGQFVGMLERDQYFVVSGFDAAYEGRNPRIQRRFLTAADRIDCDVVVLRHVLEHISNPHEFLGMLAEVFGDALLFCEVPDFEWITQNECFFDVTYEHVNYFSKESLASLFGGRVNELGRLFKNQYLYVVARLGMLSKSFGREYLSETNWRNIGFDQLFPSLRNQIDALEQVASGRRVFVWGAATKGALFVYHCQRLNQLSINFQFLVDLNPSKWSKFVPGTKLQIRSPDDLFSCAEATDVVVIANPNYEDEIRLELRKNGLQSIDVFTL